MAEEISMCVDCLMFAANGDTSEDEDRATEVARGFGRWYNNGYVIATGDSDNDDDFCKDPCDVCDSPLAGSRHHGWAIPRTTTGETHD